MSRGGRGGGRGGKRGPDMSWDDEEPTEVLPNSRKPGPLFPDRYIPAPKPLTPSEKASVTSLISFRDRMRRGPLYAVLDPTLNQKTMTTSDSKPSSSTTKPNPRAGFDPFTDQEKYTMKYHRKRRTVPDLSERGGYTLRLFPLELWPVLDPKRRMEEWEGLSEEQKARVAGVGALGRGRKRKREVALRFDEQQEEEESGVLGKRRRRRGSGSEASDEEGDDDEEDVVSPSRRRKRNEARRRDGAEVGKTRQKKGLDAEDDYPDVEQDEDAEGAQAEDEPGDSEFGTDDEADDGADDYNAEQYFDDGADELDGGGGDGDEDGGGGYY